MKEYVELPAKVVGNTLRAAPVAGAQSEVRRYAPGEETKGVTATFVFTE